MSRTCASIASRGTAETWSGRPMLNANPAELVASAWNPRWRRNTALPASHGLGMTKQPDAWRARNAATAGAWLIAGYYPRGGGLARVARVALGGSASSR